MNFLEDVYRLSYIKRYSNVPKIKEESVAEHCFFVSVIVMWLNEKYIFDLGKALAMAVAHDIPEMELNDCPHIIKKKYPEIAKAYEVCERDVMKQLPPTIAMCAEWYDQLNTPEAKIVHLADAMQCYQFADIEVKLGNQGYMKVVYENSGKRIDVLEKELEKYERGRGIEES